MCGGQSQRRRRTGEKRARKEISLTPVMLRSSAKPSDFCFAFILCNRELLADGPNPSVFRAFRARSEGGGVVRGFFCEQRVASGAREETSQSLSLSFAHCTSLCAREP